MLDTITDTANPCAICQRPNPSDRHAPGFQVCPKCLQHGRIVGNFNPPPPVIRRNFTGRWQPIEKN